MKRAKKLLPFIGVAYVILSVLFVFVTQALGETEASGDCGPGGSAQKVSGTTFNAEQLANAGTIVATTKSMLPNTPYAAVVALAVAMQESSLTNTLTELDHDSVGLFQQRVSIYGRATAADPVKATQAFLQRLVKLKNWQNLPLTVAAADVQRPAAQYRDAYAKWQGQAEQLVEKLWPGAVLTCAEGGGPPASPGEGLPAGYHLPSDPQLATVVKFALDQRGEPYAWGGSGPDSWDCSGLMQAAWATIGANIPRTTQEQFRFGTAETLSTMQPGDLIFSVGVKGPGEAPPSMTNPGHVGMYIGVVNGVQYLVQAPRTGDVVRVSKVSDWNGQIAGVRRPTKA